MTLSGERGLSESLQWAVLAPLTILATLGVVQTGIVLHARTAAGEAAGAAVEALAIGGDAEQARGVARRVASAADLRDVDVRVVEGPTLVSVEVEGRANTFLDIGQGVVRSSATQPRERPR